MYIIRLDDASDLMNKTKWDEVEKILDKYYIKPIVGVIPKNKDPEFQKYKLDEKFWSKAVEWQKKGWYIALHGFEHKYITNNSGINPVNNRSEFAGLSLEEQRYRIRNGYEILKSHNLNPSIFFAPSHTYDKNTLLALKEETNIVIISDTVANDIYFKDGFYFIPVQSGKLRRLFFKTTTFCLHPNVMNDMDLEKLESFIKKNKLKFKNIKLKTRKISIYDLILKKIYFSIKKIKK